MKIFSPNEYVSARMGAKLTDSDVCALLGVSARTVARWRRVGAPAAVVLLLRVLGGDLGSVSDRWDGWRIARRSGALVSPEGTEHTPGDLRAAWFERQYVREVRRARRQTAPAAPQPSAAVLPFRR